MLHIHPRVLLLLLSTAAFAACKRHVGTTPERRTAATHPIEYYVSLPEGWSKDRRWPVVISVTGSGKDWVANAQQFAAERDRRGYPFITVTPIGVTNAGPMRGNKNYTYDSLTWNLIEGEGRCAFDFNGVRAIAADVATNFNGDSSVFLTGFSGGGHFAIAEALLHPDEFRAAAIVASNFNNRCITKPTEAEGDVLAPQTISAHPARAKFPLRFFNGSEDGATSFLSKQRDSAMALARRSGFENVSSTTVRGARHEPMPKQVLEFFSSILGPNER